MPGDEKQVEQLTRISGVNSNRFFDVEATGAGAVILWLALAVAGKPRSTKILVSLFSNCRFTLLYMASGFGFSGGRSRCFPFWQEFSKCYANAERPEDCSLAKDDYLECLHHTKEVHRAKIIKAHYLSRQSKDLEAKRQEAETKAVSGIMSLGLLSAEDDGPPKQKEQPKKAESES